jgi:hypothetical protein
MQAVKRHDYVTVLFLLRKKSIFLGAIHVGSADCVARESADWRDTLLVVVGPLLFSDPNVLSIVIVDHNE